MIWQEFPSNISNPYCFITMLHQRTLQRTWYTNKSEVQIPLSRNIASFVRWKISLFNDASLHVLTNSIKSTYYYKVASHQVWVHSLSTMWKRNSVLVAYNNTEVNTTYFIQMWTDIVPPPPQTPKTPSKLPLEKKKKKKILPKKK